MRDDEVRARRVEVLNRRLGQRRRTVQAVPERHADALPVQHALFDQRKGAGLHGARSFDPAFDEPPNHDAPRQRSVLRQQHRLMRQIGPRDAPRRRRGP